jgi:hypothetical protein
VWSLDARGRLVACPIADVLLAGQSEPEQRRIDSRGDVTAEAKAQWRDNHPADEPMRH